MQTFPPLPSDGVPHMIDDGPVAAVGPCMCTDCVCARRVVVEQAVARYNRMMDNAMDVQRKFIEAPAKRRANPRRRGR